MEKDPNAPRGATSSLATGIPPGAAAAPGAAADSVVAGAVTPAKLRMPFAARVQGLLILVLLVGLVLIVQQRSLTLYRVGLPMLVVSAFLQIAFGNIPPRARFGRSMALLALTWAIVAALFFASVKLAPTLIDATRNTGGS